MSIDVWNVRNSLMRKRLDINDFPSVLFFVYRFVKYVTIIVTIVYQLQRVCPSFWVVGDTLSLRVRNVFVVHQDRVFQV